MAKNMRNIVDELLKEGFDVKIYVRKDGGILIRSINGAKFVGAEGNRIAREMVGETLSERRAVQLQEATKKRTSFSQVYGKRAYGKFKSIATKWKKAQLPKSAGKLTLKKLRRIAEEEGFDVAMKYLSEKEKYATGIAYSKNVEMLAEAIEEYAGKAKTGKDLLYDLADKIRENMDKIREDDIYPAYQELYLLDKGYDVRDVVRNVERTLKI